jgi:hypothetical protein
VNFITKIKSDITAAIECGEYFIVSIENNIKFYSLKDFSFVIMFVSRDTVLSLIKIDDDTIMSGDEDGCILVIKVSTLLLLSTNRLQIMSPP